MRVTSYKPTKLCHHCRSGSTGECVASRMSALCLPPACPRDGSLPAHMIAACLPACSHARMPVCNCAVGHCTHAVGHVLWDWAHVRPWLCCRINPMAWGLRAFSILELMSPRWQVRGHACEMVVSPLALLTCRPRAPSLPLGQRATLSLSPVLGLSGAGAGDGSDAGRVHIGFLWHCHFQYIHLGRVSTAC